MSKALIRGRYVWLAWYPLRGKRCSFVATRHANPDEPKLDGWLLLIALGPLFFSLGPGVPLP